MSQNVLFKVIAKALSYVKTHKTFSDKYRVFIMLLFLFTLHIVSEHLLPGA